MSGDNKKDEYYLYKAKKYHHKIKKKLLNMQKEGKTIPDAYKHYLQDFSMTGGKAAPDTISEALADATKSVKTGV